MGGRLFICSGKNSRFPLNRNMDEMSESALQGPS